MPNLLVLGIALPLFLVAVVLAVSSYQSGARLGVYRKFALRALPYAVVVLAALYFARGSNDWAIIGLELAFYIALTWVVVWAVRKQWVKH